jgi:hypothetical protein
MNRSMLPEAERTEAVARMARVEGSDSRWARKRRGWVRGSCWPRRRPSTRSIAVV